MTPRAAAGAAPRRLVIPAVIAPGRAELLAVLARLGGIFPVVQLDVMDGRFVPAVSLDCPLEGLPGPARYEAHLMVADPAAWLERHHEAAQTIIVHAEAAGKNLGAILERIRARGRRAGLALNPETPVENALAQRARLDHLLVMTVHPGAYGAPFLPETLAKVARLRQELPEVDLEVDGGITPETIAPAAAAGANLFVSGSYLIRSAEPAAARARLEAALAAKPAPGGPARGGSSRGKTAGQA